MFRLFALLSFLAVLCLGCTRAPDPVDADLLPSIAYAPYVSGFTAGMVSNSTAIEVEFAQALPRAPSDSLPPAKLLTLSPSVAGQLHYVGTTGLRFTPSSPLTNGAEYVVQLALKQARPDAPDSLSALRWRIQVVDQGLALTTARLRPAPLGDPARQQQIVGKLRTFDGAPAGLVEESLQAVQGNRQLPISWSHQNGDRDHAFVVDDVARSEEASAVSLRWRGQALGVSLDSTRTLTVPSTNSFSLLSTELTQGDDQVVTLHFSDLLDEQQDLAGLVYLSDGVEAKLARQANLLLVYPAQRLVGDQQLTIDASLRSATGQRLERNHVTTVPFTDLKPAIELVGDGVIVPSSQGATFPFRAVGLSAVHARIVRIYTDNVAQFLQDNRLDGSSRLARVGRPVFDGDVPLTADGPVDYLAWNLFALDLSALIEPEPGALYNVRLDFRPRHSQYPCETPPAEPLDLRTAAEKEAAFDQLNYYDYSDNYYYGDERLDPCELNYYESRQVSRNFLASNIGLLAKRGSTGQLLVVATDLTTAQPIPDLAIEVLNKQQQLQASAKTARDGVATFALERAPFLAVAKRDGERAYLRLDDGEALSTSTFDVGGERTRDGIRGVIYGERGVWRPGDSIYLTLALQRPEQAQATPAPVIFELLDPAGQVVERRAVAEAAPGLYDLRTATSEDARTGTWQARVQADAAQITTSVRVETVMPNRLKVELSFGAEPARLYQSSTAQLAARWLHGAPAGALQADVQFSARPIAPSFAGGSMLLRGSLKDYSFVDRSREAVLAEREVFSGKLNVQGTRDIDLRLDDLSTLPGLLRGRFTTRVFEQTGAFSTVSQSLTLSPFASYVGVRVPKSEDYYGLARDQAHTFDIVVLDDTGTPVPRQKLEVEVYNIDWSYWWERTNSNTFASYVANRAQYLGQQHTIRADQGRSQFEADFSELSFGRKLIRVYDPISGHAATATFYLADPRWRNDASSRPGGAELLAFTLDNTSYQPGETLTVTLPAFPGGRAFVSIEDGASVRQYQWVTGTAEAQQVALKLDEGLAPNAYVHVSLVQAHGQTSNDQPIRLYGVQPFQVEDPKRRLEPVLALPKALEPEEPFDVEVSESTGRAMSYTLAVVEEGLLDITSFKTPDLYERFNRRAALGVRSFDVYDQVLGAFTGRLAGLLAVGGDEETGDRPDPRANRFRPVVKHLGPFRLAAGQRKSHRITMPNYVGSVRVMLVAAAENAYGSEEATVPVKRPLMAVATLPRVLGPAEGAELPVTVFAMEPGIRDVQVTLTELTGLEAESTTQNLRFDRPGEQLARFRIRSSDHLGMARVRVQAEGSGFSASDEIELQVRAPNPRLTTVQRAVVPPGETWSTNYQPIGLPGTNEGVLEVSGSYPVNLASRLDYLVSYPHGCLEQTVSAAFPQLYLNRFTTLSAGRAADVQRNITAAITKTQRFRLSEGGYSYWPGQRQADAWTTSYVGHFLIAAEQAGYRLPPNTIAGWARSLQRAANAWTPARVNAHPDEVSAVQAYRLFVLALAKRPLLGAMNRLRGTKQLDDVTLNLLAAAYQLAGQEEAAQVLLRRSPSRADRSSTHRFSYGSALRDQAIGLFAQALIRPPSSLAQRFAQEVSDQLSSNRWHSTQATSWGLLAMAQFLGGEDPGQPLQYQYDLAASGSASTDQSERSRSYTLSSESTEAVRVVNTGQRKLYLRLASSGIPPARASQSASATNLKLDVAYVDLGGRTLDPTTLPQGQDFIARVTVSHPGRLGSYQELALSQVFPSGWEIRNRRLAGKDGSSTLDYQDIRDDRVLSYFDLAKGTSTTIEVQLNAAYRGRYYLPEVAVEAMYDRDVRARTPGRWVEVR